MKYLFFILIVLTSCSPEYLTKSELTDFVADKENGLLKEKNIRDINISVNYRPTDLLVAQELGDAKRTKQELEKIRKNYEKYHYFILNISKNNKELLRDLNSGFSTYSNMLQTLAFDMGKYVNMTTSTNDTIPVADYIYPRLYGASRSTSLMFVFSKENVNKNAEWLQFNLKDLGVGTGNLHLRFDKDELESIPKLKLEAI